MKGDGTDLGRRLILPEDGKALVNGELRDMVEMGFWAIRFLEGFEQQLDKYGRAEDPSNNQNVANGRVENGEKLWNSNARAFFKLIRYVTKYLSVFDGFYKRQ